MTTLLPGVIIVAFGLASIFPSISTTTIDLNASVAFETTFTTSKVSTIWLVDLHHLKNPQLHFYHQMNLLTLPPHYHTPHYLNQIQPIIIASVII